MLTRRPKIIGITGGVGAGKSAAAQVIRDMGYVVVDSDTIAREILKPGSEGLREVQNKIGGQFVSASGDLDRQALRTHIIASPKAREQLDAITHPRIQAESQRQLKAILDCGAPFVFYEAPLLFEAKADKKMDAVICITADDEIRIQRIVVRDHASAQAAELLLKSQMPQDQKAKMSEFVIENNQDHEALKRKVTTVLEEILKLPLTP
jgi:dephospho-CoA kinase